MTTSWRAFEPSMMFSSLRHQPRPIDYLTMSSIVFNFGDTSKEVDLKDVNSADDLASNMKEVITEEKAKTSKKEVK